MIILDHWVENLRCLFAEKPAQPGFHRRTDGTHAWIAFPKALKLSSRVWPQLLLLFKRQPSGPHRDQQSPTIPPIVDAMIRRGAGTYARGARPLAASKGSRTRTVVPVPSDVDSAIVPPT